jgi:hypothetical protein
LIQNTLRACIFIIAIFERPKNIENHEKNTSDDIAIPRMKLMMELPNQPHFHYLEKSTHQPSSDKQKPWRNLALQNPFLPNRMIGKENTCSSELRYGYRFPTYIPRRTKTEYEQSFQTVRFSPKTE